MTRCPHRADRNSKGGFAQGDLIALMAMVSLVTLLAVPMTASSVAGSHRITCMSNLKRLGQAFLLYAADNQGYSPHPTWGSNLTGPNGWAYATRNDGHFPEAGPSPRSQVGKTFSAAREAQLPFLKMGQIWPYVLGEDAYLCPGDFAGWDSPVYRKLQMARPWKLTSFSANAAIFGYDSLPGPAGSTIRLSWFLPGDAILWEVSETEGFYFNDAGTVPHEPLTVLHDGGGNLAAADGRVEWMGQDTYRGLARTTTRNRLWCNPLMQNGGPR